MRFRDQGSFRRFVEGLPVRRNADEHARRRQRSFSAGDPALLDRVVVDKLRNGREDQLTIHEIESASEGLIPGGVFYRFRAWLDRKLRSITPSRRPAVNCRPCMHSVGPNPAAYLCPQWSDGEGMPPVWIPVCDEHAEYWFDGVDPSLWGTPIFTLSGSGWFRSCGDCGQPYPESEGSERLCRSCEGS